MEAKKGVPMDIECGIIDTGDLDGWEHGRGVRN